MCLVFGEHLLEVRNPFLWCRHQDMFVYVLG